MHPIWQIYEMALQQASSKLMIKQQFSAMKRMYIEDKLRAEDILEIDKVLNSITAVIENEEKIKTELERIWINEIRQAFENGMLCSERQLQAEIYFYLKTLLPDFEIWIEPVLNIKTEDLVRPIIPDIVITKGNQIFSIIELKYNPPGEVKVKDDFGKLQMLSLLNNNEPFIIKRIYKNINEVICKSFTLNKDPLCVYAAIAAEHAYGIRNRLFWQEHNYEVSYPNNILHLAGIVYKSNKTEFTVL